MPELIDAPELIDIGANLTHNSFGDDLGDVVARARSAGVLRMIVTGSSVDGSREAIEMASRYRGELFATAGIHPHHAGEFDTDAAAEIEALADDAVAVGECGLDYFRNYCPHDQQLEAFEGQLRIAAKSGKPVFLHQREAHDPFTALLKDYLPQISGGVAHCFTGNRAEMSDYLDMGLYIGITGWVCDERRSADLREALAYLPLDRVLLETDAPYLLPRDLKQKLSGRRNEPSFLPHILETASRYMNKTAAEVGEAATRNTRLLFNLPEPVDAPKKKPPEGGS
jgi:TatD DNase family protein